MECKYSGGVEMLKAGDYRKAKALFYEAIGYKDARERFDSIKSKPKTKITISESGNVSNTENTYDERGNLIKSVTGDSSTEYLYDEQGQLIKSISSTFTSEYFYDGQGNAVKVLFENRLRGTRFAAYSGVTESTYDDQGKLLKTVTTYDNGRVETTDYSQDINTYDERGNLIKTVSKTYTKEYSYDEYGNLVKETRIKTDGSTYSVSYSIFEYYPEPTKN